MKGPFQITVITAALLTGCFFVAGCENDEAEVNEFSRKVIMVEEGKNIISYLSQNGTMKAKLVSPQLFRFQADTLYSEFPDSLHVDFYDDSLQVETQLNALYGKYYETLNMVYLRDSVVIHNIGGDTLRCPEMWWDQAKAKFYNDTTWRLDTKNGTHLKGNGGFEATQDLKSIIFKDPKGVFPSNTPDSL
ncbi:MAG: LPS export ABC transporter periplasmic protein LptC [Terrimonas sp.]|nr:LPS export ABC transporter periplasmic protein LptC [Terrimonas sp.]